MCLRQKLAYQLNKHLNALCKINHIHMYLVNTLRLLLTWVAFNIAHTIHAHG